MEIDLKVKIGKLELMTPIICASGTFGFGEELKGLVDFSHIGAITTKTITVEPRQGNPPPRIYETGQGVINSVGLENPGLKVFLEEKLPLIKKLKTKCIASIGGFSTEEYKTLVHALDKRGEVHAIEANLSCPNLQLKKLISQSPQHTYELAKALRAITRKTLIIKITPEVNDITEIAQAAQEAKADALSLVNTFFAMAIDIERQKPFIGNNYGGYSGPAIKPMALYRVWRAAQKISIPIIGGGGITTAQDAVEFFLAGATAISLGTVNLVHPGAASEIIKGVKGYLKHKKVLSVKEIVRKLVCN